MKSRVITVFGFDLTYTLSTEVLTMHNNDIGGTIPTQIGLLTGMTIFSLFGNPMTGTIPSELGEVTALERLFLHFSDLTGTMPEEICQLRNQNLVQLSANCAGENPLVQCEQPDCCTVCF